MTLEEMKAICENAFSQDKKWRWDGHGRLLIGEGSLICFSRDLEGLLCEDLEFIETFNPERVKKLLAFVNSMVDLHERGRIECDQNEYGKPCYFMEAIEELEKE